ncbi:MAG: glutaredoxin domain-containing protein [Arcanobacterium sp.]
MASALQTLYDFEQEVARLMAEDKIPYSQAVETTALLWDAEQPWNLVEITGVSVQTSDYVQLAVHKYSDLDYRKSVEDQAADLTRYGCFREDHVATLEIHADRHNEGLSKFFNFDDWETLPTLNQLEQMLAHPMFNIDPNDFRNDGLNAEGMSMSEVQAEMTEQFPALVADVMAETTVTLYAKPECVQCNATERLFKRNDVPFNRVDMDKNVAALEFVKERGHQAAPVVIVQKGHKVVDEWSGFNPDKIKAVTKTTSRSVPRPPEVDKPIQQRGVSR